MTEFCECLKQQLKLHPSMTPRDVVKLCYQAACGAEHLLSDAEGARAYFEEEYAAVKPKDESLYEQISESVCRVNLAAWKHRSLPKEWLFRMFTATVFSADGKQRLGDYLAAAEPVLAVHGFDMTAWQNYLNDYTAQGMPPVRHSESYRAAERPAYRIVDAAFLPLLPILERAAQADHTPYVIVIDGKAGAGKSTLAARLQQVLEADMVYMDDFFLPPVLRTPERLTEAGGNIHYERFAEQMLPYISRPEPFAYEVFDCSIMELNGKHQLTHSPYRIVEGSYSMHPKFGSYGDLRVFVDIDPDTQLQRILKRNGEAMAERFRTQWIPMENRYFEAYEIADKADLILK